MTRSELADAMLKGYYTPNVVEAQLAYCCSEYITDERIVCRACALGCALIGKCDGDYDKAERLALEAEDRAVAADPTILFADLIGIDRALAVEIEHKHLNGKSIEQIAVWLKTSEQEAEHV